MITWWVFVLVLNSTPISFIIIIATVGPSESCSFLVVPSFKYSLDSGAVEYIIMWMNEWKFLYRA